MIVAPGSVSPFGSVTRPRTNPWENNDTCTKRRTIPRKKRIEDRVRVRTAKLAATLLGVVTARLPVIYLFYSPHARGADPHGSKDPFLLNDRQLSDPYGIAAQVSGNFDPGGLWRALIFRYVFQHEPWRRAYLMGTIPDT
jgi:hypothetical protein